MSGHFHVFRIPVPLTKICAQSCHLSFVLASSSVLVLVRLISGRQLSDTHILQVPSRSLHRPSSTLVLSFMYLRLPASGLVLKGPGT
jgi:hypothetical protein